MSWVLISSCQLHGRWVTSKFAANKFIAVYRINAWFNAYTNDREYKYWYLVENTRDAGKSIVGRPAWRICSTNGRLSTLDKKRDPNRKKPGPPPVHDDLCAYLKARCEISTRRRGKGCTVDLWPHRTPHHIRKGLHLFDQERVHQPGRGLLAASKMKPLWRSPPWTILPPATARWPTPSSKRTKDRNLGPGNTRSHWAARPQSAL